MKVLNKKYMKVVEIALEFNGGLQVTFQHPDGEAISIDKIKVEITKNCFIKFVDNFSKDKWKKFILAFIDLDKEIKNGMNIMFKEIK